MIPSLETSHWGLRKEKSEPHVSVSTEGPSEPAGQLRPLLLSSRQNPQEHKREHHIRDQPALSPPSSSQPECHSNKPHPSQLGAEALSWGDLTPCSCPTPNLRLKLGCQSCQNQPSAWVVRLGSVFSCFSQTHCNAAHDVPLVSPGEDKSPRC